MRKTIRLTALLLLCLALLGCVSCKKEEGAGDAEKPDVLALNIEDYVRLGEYKGMTLTCAEGKTRAQTAWEAVARNAEVLSYPSGLVEYYIAHTQARYRYYAEKNGMEYEDVLRDFGLDENGIEEESKALAMEDLIFAAVVRAGGISLTEDEKRAHFERYAEHYVSEYGYTAEYVRENLAEEIYGSMLYDKTSEYLIINNTFN